MSEPTHLHLVLSALNANTRRSAPIAIGADIRGYYDHLGVDIPEWASREVNVRCFADPDAHRNGDRHPSCSVNLEHGAWHCHGCGAKGGLYDAATALGYSARAAIDLMVRYGLTERRFSSAGVSSGSGTSHAQPRRLPRPRFTVTERDVRHWQNALSSQTALIGRLTRERAWFYSTMLELEIGYDCGRLTIPVRDEHGQLAGLLRYQPWPRGDQPKIVAATGSRRRLLPHPATETAARLLLVEGEPDMIAARSRGVPAIAVPGAETWRPEWARLFAGRDVTIVMDCDREGRRAAERIAQDLYGLADARVFDIAPDRRDGYDLTNLFLDHPRLATEVLR